MDGGMTVLNLVVFCMCFMTLPDNGMCQLGAVGVTAARVGFHVGLSRHLAMQPSDSVLFNKIITNAESGYDNNTGIFTSPVDGMYSFTATFKSDSDKLLLEMLHNKDRVSAAYADKDGSCTMNAVLIINKGDKIKIRHSSLGLVGRIEAELCYFSGYRVD